MRLVRWFAGAIVLSMVVAVAAIAAAPLDDTLWRVEVTEEGSAVPQYIDRISYKEGKFNSVIFSRKGFQAAAYSYSEKSGAPLVWDVDQKAEAAGELVWHGERKGDALTGSLTFKQPDGKVVKYALVGSPVVEEPAATDSGAPAGSSAAGGAKSKGWNWGCSKK